MKNILLFLLCIIPIYFVSAFYPIWSEKQDNIFSKFLMIEEGTIKPINIEAGTEKEGVLLYLDSSGRNVKIFEEADQIASDMDSSNWGIDAQVIEIYDFWENRVCSLQYMIYFDSINKVEYCDQIWKDAVSFFPADMMCSMAQGISDKEIAQWEDQEGNMVTVFLAPEQDPKRRCILIQIVMRC